MSGKWSRDHALISLFNLHTTCLFTHPLVPNLCDSYSLLILSERRRLQALLFASFTISTGLYFTFQPSTQWKLFNLSSCCRLCCIGKKGKARGLRAAVGITRFRRSEDRVGLYWMGMLAIGLEIAQSLVCSNIGIWRDQLFSVNGLKNPIFFRGVKVLRIIFGRGGEGGF